MGSHGGTEVGDDELYHMGGERGIEMEVMVVPCGNRWQGTEMGGNVENREGTGLKWEVMGSLEQQVTGPLR